MVAAAHGLALEVAVEQVMYFNPLELQQLNGFKVEELLQDHFL